MQALDDLEAGNDGARHMRRSPRVWYPGAETALYRALAAVAARAIGGLPFVRAVYARRSVASREVVLGRSDVDLHVVIAPFDDPLAEGRALALLARRLRRLARVLPILGDVDVSTVDDLARWYRNRPGYWHRDRGWLRLWGEVVERPEPDPADPELRDSWLRWFALSVVRLPAPLRRGAVHHCVNLLVDLLHAHGLVCAGGARAWLGPGGGEALTRAEVLARWRRADPADPRRARLAAGYAEAFRRGAGSDLLSLVLDVALDLGESLAAELRLEHGGDGLADALDAWPPFAYQARRYLLPDRRSAADLARALAALERDPGVVVTTRGTLAVVLRYFHPWEWTALARANPRPGLVAPREEDYLAAVRCSLHSEFPRAAVLRGGAHVVQVGLRLAQCKAYLDDGRVAALREDLAGVYEAIYGRPPDAGATDPFTTHYPASVRLIRELAVHPRLGCRG